MNTLPTTEEAKMDLESIRAELKAMRAIVDEAGFLAWRDDVDANYYKGVRSKVLIDISRGASLEYKILELYPSLK